MNSNWDIEKLSMELTGRQKINYTIYGCTNTFSALNGICSDTRSIYKNEYINL